MTNTYCALYRKYRPENLDDVVGQNVIVKTLKNAIKNNQISHAYLFTGPRGTGKTSIAKVLAKTINCLDLNETTPCNKCVSCTQINQKQNIDIIEIDAASNNGVDEIREIRNKVSLVPSISKFKVYIIDEVHMLTTGAFNALLKTLEEPPSHIIFILATTEPHKIPNTILSRCQRFDFKRISVNDIYDRLKFICDKENISITDEAIKQIAVSSDGGMRDAVGTLDQVIAYAENDITATDVHEINGTLSNEELSSFVDYLLTKNLNSVLELIDNYYNNGKNIVKILEELVVFLKNILLMNTAPVYFKNNQYDSQVFEKYCKVDTSEIIEYITTFNSEINEIKKSNLPKFLFELLMIKAISNKTVKGNEVNITKEEFVPKKNIEEQKCIEKKEQPKLMQTKKEETKVVDTKLVELQNLRIANTLSRFNKQNTIKLRSEFEGLSSLLMNPDVCQIVSMILDGSLKAASDEYIILVFETQNSTNIFNENLINIEKVLNEFLENKYRVIGVEESEWNIIKEGFNHKTKTFEYKQEDESSLDFQLNEVSQVNDIEQMFGDTVEYEN